MDVHIKLLIREFIKSPPWGSLLLALTPLALCYSPPLSELQVVQAQLPLLSPAQWALLATAGLVVRLAQASTRTHVLRLDTEDETVEKLILDAGSAEALDRWVLALGNTGAIVPAEYLGRLDERALELLSATQTPRRRRIKKGWLEMKTTLTTRATSGSLAEWQAHWLSSSCRC